MDSSTSTSSEPGGNPTRTFGRLPWIGFLFLMVAYIVAMTWMGHGRTSSEPALSNSVQGLVADTALALLIFAVPFGIGIALTRPTRADLFLGSRTNPWLTWLLGAVWSVVLRLAIMVPAVAAVVVFMALDPKNGLEKFKASRPQVENLLDPGALADPFYAFVCITWLSFVVAGLREELWRAAMIRGISSFGPGGIPTRRLEWIAVAVSSAFFGLAHLTQGPIAVFATGLLGVGLGMIQIVRRSLPEAVIAHGFFDATTFFFIFFLQQKDLLKRLGVPDDLLDQILNR
jgi:membrane protease YdiL (CAAX protease family)